MSHFEVGAKPESKQFSLSKLQSWVRGAESLLGPIVKIGNDGTQTAGTFDVANPDNPSSPILSVVKITTTGNAPADTKKLCDGWAFVSGALQHVIVLRPAA